MKTRVNFGLVWAVASLAACGGGSTTAGDAKGDADVPTIIPDAAAEIGLEVPGDTALHDPAAEAQQPDPGAESAQPDPGAETAVPDPGADEGTGPDTSKTDQGTIVECEDDGDCEAKLSGLGACQVARCEMATHTCVARAAADGKDCDDLNACTKDDYCSKGVCKGKPVVCDDGNVCTTDDCDPDTGCKALNNTASCDDGNECTKGDKCAAGKCVSGENTCECEEDKDCIPFDDQDRCNGVMKCVANACKVDETTRVNCDTSGDTPCKTTTCNPSTGECEVALAADGKPCDDGSACTQGEACTGGECTGGAAVACDDQNVCTTDTCDPKAGCVFTPNADPCDDGNACTEGDTCANGTCQPGALTCPTTCEPAMSLFCDVSHKYDNGGEGSTNVAAAYACNPGAAYSGPEYTYVFVAPYDGTFTISLSDEAADTDVLVLESGDGCDPAKCIAWGTEKVTFEATSYRTYYLVVDGFEGATGAYSIHVSCVPAVEPYCDDGVDNDQDGLTDCDDKDDCLGTETCPYPGCSPAFWLDCGDKDVWATYLFGATNQVDGYSCNSNFYTGPEYAYEFTSASKQKVLVKLTNESGVTDLMVLKGDCASNTCIDYGAVQSTFIAEKDETYYFVVDGRDGVQGRYTIQVTCSPVTEQVCNDDGDDDGDGLVDCADPDCLGTETCPTCQWDYVLECGDIDSWSTGGEGATDAVDIYGCTDMAHEGPEYTYFFRSEIDQTVTITLSDETADIDVHVLEAGDSQACNPAACLDWAMDELTFEAKAGALYYIVVDAWTGGVDPVFSGDYTIELTCM